MMLFATVTTGLCGDTVATPFQLIIIDGVHRAFLYIGVRFKRLCSVMQFVTD